MSNQLAITVAAYENGFAVSIPSQSLALKQQALARAEPIKQVTNGDEQTAAVQAAAIVKGLLTEAEKARETVKKPYWDAGKAIDAKAKEFSKELDAEAKRLESLIAAFQRAEQEKAAAVAREAERLRLETEATAQRERDRLAQIEADRAAAEAVAANAKTKKAREAAAAEAERLRLEQAEAELASMETDDDAAAANVIVVQAEAPRASGAAVSFVRDFEVTDLDAFILWDIERRRMFDKIQKERLAENGSARPFIPMKPLYRAEIAKQLFNGFISDLDDGILDSIPGVKIIKTAKAAVRGVAPALTLH